MPELTFEQDRFRMAYELGFYKATLKSIVDCETLKEARKYAFDAIDAANRIAKEYAVAMHETV
jgi:hypothetical protein